jgi:hypothetical protein
MTKSNLFKKAHKIARTLEGDYSARLALALRQVWSEIKGGSKVNKLVEARKAFLDAVENGEKRRATNKLLESYRTVITESDFDFEKVNGEHVIAKVEATQITIFDETELTFKTIAR